MPENQRVHEKHPTLLQLEALKLLLQDKLCQLYQSEAQEQQNHVEVL